jgi:hypothetical protein
MKASNGDAIQMRPGLKSTDTDGTETTVGLSVEDIQQERTKTTTVERRGSSSAGGTPGARLKLF